MRTTITLIFTLAFLCGSAFAADPPAKPKAIARTKATAKAAAPAQPKPTLAKVAYGTHERQVLDFWKAKSAQPTPLLFYIHGGGWIGGDKSLVSGVDKYLAAGISVASINYRYVTQAIIAGVKPPVAWPLRDAARALQFVRSKAPEWNKEYSPFEHVTADDPPVYLYHSAPPALGQEQKDPTHTANFGVKLQEKCRSVGVECELVYPGAPDVKHATAQEFLIETLKAARR